LEDRRQMWDILITILKEQFERLGVDGIDMKPPPVDSCPHSNGYVNEPFTYCCRPILEGSQFCFWHTRNTEKYASAIMQVYFGDDRDLKQAVEQEKRALSGAFLRNAAIGGNMLSRGADLSGADLRAADLRDAHLSYGSLNGANLAMANLDSAFLSDVDIRHVIFTLANLHNVKFRNNDFSGVKGLSRESFVGREGGVFARPTILEEYPEYAEGAYRSLMTLFSSLSQLDDASWAAFRSRIMRHRRLKKKLRFQTHIFEAGSRGGVAGEHVSARATFETAVRNWIINAAEYLKSLLFRIVFGYGEKPLNVILTSLVAMLFYAWIYNWLGVLPEKGFRTALYFSIVTFTTLGYGDLAPKPAYRLWAGSEALVGIVLSGLFLFTLARRASGRG
jgi:hypothetical protein